jgi:hypothetical protein
LSSSNDFEIGSSYLEYIQWSKGQLKSKPTFPDDIPAHPYGVYGKGKDWKGIPDFLGSKPSGKICTDVALFENTKVCKEAKANVINRIYKMGKCRTKRRSRKTPEIPVIPAKKYKQQWRGWNDWLGRP